jgi:hypothetical protein
MRDVEKEFPNIYNSNSVKLENFALKSITDDTYLDPEKLVTYVEFTQGYIINNLSEYGDEPRLKKPLYIHTPDRSILSFMFKGNENFNYQAILTREGEKEGVDVRSYFIMKNESDMILKIHRIKDDVVSVEEDDSRNSQLYEEIEEILDYINSVQSGEWEN